MTKAKEFDLKMDKIKFEPTIETRQQYIRKRLCDRFAKILEKKLTPPVIIIKRNLQGSKIVQSHNQSDASSNNEKSNQDSSVWCAYAHPIRRYRRTNEFTKPDREYFGTSQWR